MLRYRSDIDGLRALAVLGVIIFHLKLGFLPGGYTGVDIFFVISGYLISKTIFEEIGRSEFSIAKFYVRRARRILPGFLSVVVLTSIAAYIFLYPAELTHYAKTAIASAFFAANLFFYSSLDYFSVGANEIPLLHLWSLGVEEQFYIFFPLIALAAIRFGKLWQSAIIAIIMLFSLLYSQSLLYIDPTASFYLLPSRAFELLIGSLIALPNLPNIRNQKAGLISATIGITAIGFSFFFYDENTKFPGIAALLPCLGTALLIVGCQQENIVGRALSLPPVRFIGKISYSLYLVHWPLIVFADRLFPTADQNLRAACVFALCLILATLNYMIIEQPFRKAKQDWRPFRVLSLSATSLFFVAAISGYVTVKNGFPQPTTARTVNAIAMLQYSYAKDFLDGTCFLRPEQTSTDALRSGCIPAAGQKSIMLWGDSHAIHLYPGLKPLIEERGYFLGALTTSGCPPILETDAALRPNCRASNTHDFEIIKQIHPSLVIMSAIWPSSPETIGKLKDTIDKLSSLGIKTVVLGTSPIYKQSVPLLVIKKVEAGETSMMSSDELELPAIITSRNAAAAVVATTNAKFVDVFKTICPKDTCAMASADETPYYYDIHHFTPVGSRHFAKELLPQIIN
ncbi:MULTISPECIES: acyltransferase family protein [Pseudomonas]|uniref:acyltransferase family protein n=1 Tax=Pseudomonas TaxID=286 RepID=UPI001CE3E9FD|nr:MULTISPECIES: acyltransferase family protein [Pseudomonas]